MAVTQMVVTSRQPFADGQGFGDVGPYEQLDGTVYFAVDPEHPTNRLIADLQLAPRDRNGLVHFSADFRIVLAVDILRRRVGDGHVATKHDVVGGKPAKAAQPLQQRQAQEDRDEDKQHPLCPADPAAWRWPVCLVL